MYTRNGARISKDNLYRYQLWREWEKGQGSVLFIMLNPSTADEQVDDPTIRRCVRFAKDWGHNRIDVVNLFAYRATDPHSLTTAVDPVGPDNFRTITQACEAAERIVCAWGDKGSLLGQADRIREMLRRYQLHALHLTRKGNPGHPLYLPSDSKLVRFS